MTYCFIPTWASQQAFGEVLFSSSAIHRASGVLSDLSRLQSISMLAWRVLLVFDWPKETIWKAADAFGKEGNRKKWTQRGY